MQVRTPHAWPALYASAVFPDGLTGAMAYALLICMRGSGRHASGDTGGLGRVSPGTRSQGDRGQLTARYRSCPRLNALPIWIPSRPIRFVGSVLKAIALRPFTGPMVMCMSTSGLCPPRSVVRRPTTRPRSSRRPPRPSNHQRQVRILGWLLHEFPHTGSHMRRATAGESHLVTGLEVWDDDHHVWQLIRFCCKNRFLSRPPKIVHRYLNGLWTQNTSSLNFCHSTHRGACSGRPPSLL